ncbi:ABC transporter ATP-binding protein, partial [Georgenia sp. 10Sc9-8]|nr:ABC transporter ATP-binding protein [Georgenia halotolerans]
VATETARITFADDDAVARLELSTLPALTAAPSRGRATWTLLSADLQATLTALLTAAARDGVHLTELEARSANLEQAFLAVASEHDPNGDPGPHDDARRPATAA